MGKHHKKADPKKAQKRWGRLGLGSSFRWGDEKKPKQA